MLMISENRCVGCGICVKDCPSGAVSLNIDKGVAVLNCEKCMGCNLCIQNCPQDAINNVEGELVFAIGTDDGKTVKQDDHFGMSRIFQIWKYSNGELTFQTERKNAKYEEDETRIHGDPKKAEAITSVLNGVDVLVGKMMGPNIVQIRKSFVPVIVRQSNIDDVVEVLKRNIIEIIDEKEKKDRRGLVLK